MMKARRSVRKKDRRAVCGQACNSDHEGADGSCYINPLSNGGFEVVWSKHGCVATFNREREALGYCNSCTNSQTYRSDDLARHHR
jgi:hypothetical protein